MEGTMHFAIHADDTQRASEFYRRVFNWRASSYAGAGVTDKEFVQVSGENVHGAIQSRKFNPLPRDVLGFECSIEVQDVNQTARLVEAAGGQIVLKRSAIPGVGWVIKFTDTEGNLCCAVQHDPTAR
jgi:predicted enzyme related to lactoylglutathione lyase